jgi:hypothetical protein
MMSDLLHDVDALLTVLDTFEFPSVSHVSSNVPRDHITPLFLSQLLRMLVE